MQGHKPGLAQMVARIDAGPGEGDLDRSRSKAQIHGGGLKPHAVGKTGQDMADDRLDQRQIVRGARRSGSLRRGPPGRTPRRRRPVKSARRGRRTPFDRSSRQNEALTDTPMIRGSSVNTLAKFPSSSGPVKASVIGVVSNTFFT